MASRGTAHTGHTYIHEGRTPVCIQKKISKRKADSLIAVKRMKESLEAEDAA